MNTAEQKQTATTDLSFGQKLAGVSFNPSNDSHVDLVKSAAANFMDAIENADWANFKNGEVIPDNHITKQIMAQAKLRALEAQMLAVKAITWKY